MIVIIILIPIIAAILSVLLKTWKFNSLITLISALLTFIFSFMQISIIESSKEHVVNVITNWISLDPLGLIILLIISFVYFTSSFFASCYMKGDNNYKFYLNFNLFVFSMLIIPLIQEPNLMWCAVELTTIFSVLLVAYEGTHESLEAAWKYIVLTLMGASIALLGFFVLYLAAKEAGINEYCWSGLEQIAPNMSPALIGTAFIMILAGFGTKIGFIPLHTWLPDAHSQAPSPVCALLSGVETTAVLYVVLKVLLIVSKIPGIHANIWITVFGLISVGGASLLLIQVKDYKRLFAFSTVEHMGIIITSIGIGGTIISYSALLQIISHAVTKSFCFYASGGILLLIGTRKISDVRSLYKTSPFIGFSVLLSGLAIAGAPPFALFLSEFSILRAGINNGHYFTVALLLLFITIAFFAIMNHISKMVFSNNKEATVSNIPISLSTKISISFSAIPVIVFGIYIPELLHKLITLAVVTNNMRVIP